MRILVATRNRGKLREYADLLADLPIEWVTLDDVGLSTEVEETGSTFEQNARLKAQAYARLSGLPTLADDSGLEVDALGGAPGVQSARYAGPNASDADRYRLLLERMEDIPDEQRSARFRCVVALYIRDGDVYTAEGVCEGRITRAPRGTHGFGYDPVFFVDEYGVTMAELPLEVKNRISHRARAIQALKPQLVQLIADRRVQKEGGMSEQWPSRRRVEVALAHQEPDRVPLDFSITLDAYIRLREYLGLPVEEHIEADRFFEVRPAPDLLNALGVDMTFVKLGRPKNWAPPAPLPDGTAFDVWGVGRKAIRLPVGSYLYEVSYSPLEHTHPADVDLDSYPWPDPYDPGYTEGLEEEARRLYEETGLALMGRFGGPILETAAYLRGYEQWLVDLVRYPDFSRQLLDRIADIQIALDEAGIRAAGKYLSVFKVSGEDLGMQDRPLFSMKVWREVLYPVLARRWRAARRALDQYAPHVKIMLHSDGAIRPFIPDIIEAGIDLLDPLQGVCPGMELEGLKRDFGDRLSFHGGVDTQHVLPFGTPQEVKAEAVRCIRALGVGGGFILAPSHFIQADVPPENIVALCQAAQQEGRYPLN